MYSKVPGLYIIATPIGNLYDITLRALDQLKNSDIIFCEDTRVTAKLCDRYNISAKLLPFTDYSDQSAINDIMAYIDQGMIISLVSDAGTPIISDPGFTLIRALKDKNYHVDSLPGPSAPIMALTLSALPSQNFFFSGFLPKTIPARRALLSGLQSLNSTLIFFETSARLIKSLNDILAVLGDRKAAVARELTKLYQEVRTESISTLISHYTAHPPKGEIVLLISLEMDENYDAAKAATLDSQIVSFIKDGLSNKDIVSLLNKSFNGTKRELYQLVTQLRHI